MSTAVAPRGENLIETRQLSSRDKAIARFKKDILGDAPYLVLRDFLRDAMQRAYKEAERDLNPGDRHFLTPYFFVRNSGDAEYRYRALDAGAVDDLARRVYLGQSRFRIFLQWVRDNLPASGGAGAEFQEYCDAVFVALLDRCLRRRDKTSHDEADGPVEHLHLMSMGRADPEHSFVSVQGLFDTELSVERVRYVDDFFARLDDSSMEKSEREEYAAYLALERLSSLLLERQDQKDWRELLEEKKREVAKTGGRASFGSIWMGIVHAFGFPRAVALWWAPGGLRLSGDEEKISHYLREAVFGAGYQLEQLLLAKAGDAAFPLAKPKLDCNDFVAGLSELFTCDSAWANLADEVGKPRRKCLKKIYEFRPSEPKWQRPVTFKSDRPVAIELDPHHESGNSRRILVRPNDYYRTAFPHLVRGTRKGLRLETLELHTDLPPGTFCEDDLRRATRVVSAQFDVSFRARESHLSNLETVAELAAAARERETEEKLRKYQTHTLNTELLFLRGLIRTATRQLSLPSNEQARRAAKYRAKGLSLGVDADSTRGAITQLRKTIPRMPVLRRTLEDALVFAASVSHAGVSEENFLALLSAASVVPSYMSGIGYLYASDLQLADLVRLNDALTRLDATPAFSTYKSNETDNPHALSHLVASAFRSAFTSFLIRANPRSLFGPDAEDGEEELSRAAKCILQDCESDSKTWVSMVASGKAKERPTTAISLADIRGWLQSVGASITLPDIDPCLVCRREDGVDGQADQAPFVFRAFVQEAFLNALKHVSEAQMGGAWVSCECETDESGRLLRFVVANACSEEAAANEAETKSRVHYGRQFLERAGNLLFPKDRWKFRYGPNQGEFSAADRSSSWRVCVRRRA